MKKIIGIFILFIGLTASILEIYSFTKEYPWVEHQLNNLLLMAKNEEFSKNTEIQKPSSNRLLITNRAIEEHIKATKKGGTNRNEVICNEDCESTFDKESSAISQFVSNKSIDLNKLKHNLSHQ